MDEQKAYMVRVSGYSGCFWFDYVQNVDWFMEMCGEDGKGSWAFKRNELGQYERYACYVMLKEQEPVEPNVIIDTLVCGNCGTRLERQSMVGDNILFTERFDYCPYCGRKVKWRVGG